MAQISIDSALLRDPLGHVNRAARRLDATRAVEELIEAQLAAWAVGDRAVDGLPGCRTRAAFGRDLARSTFGSGWAAPSPFEERYLVFDVVDMNTLLDRRGLEAGDRILAALATATHELYGPADVYRVGGDDFFVRLGARPCVLPSPPDGVTLKWAEVSVHLKRTRRRHDHLNAWITHRLDGALLGAKPDGARATVGDPPTAA